MNVAVIGSDDGSTEPPLPRGLEFNVPKRSEGEYVNNSTETYKFLYDRVFEPNAPQDAVFDIAVKDIVNGAMDGYNGTVFAYGQTGSGKTHTITGGERYTDRGIIPRTLTAIFESIDARPDATFRVFVSYMEIYNENIYDLLDRENADRPLEEWNKVQLLDDKEGDLHLKNLRVYEAETEQIALNLLFLGNVNRVTSETPMNQASSRSHCIFTITIECRRPGSEIVRTSKLHLVDLAGSERVYKSTSAEATRREGRSINLSLHYLEQVILALHDRARGVKVHIPYRNSLMTSVLRDSLGGNSRTVFITTINTEAEFAEESMSTCRFAQRCAMLSHNVELNEEMDMSVVVARLKKENQELRAKLEQALSKGALGGRLPSLPPSSYGGAESKPSATSPKGFRELSQPEIARCEEKVVQYLHFNPDVPTSADGPRTLDCSLEFEDMSEARVCCALLKSAVQRAVQAVSDSLQKLEEAEARVTSGERALDEQTEALTKYNAVIKELSAERNRWKELAQMHDMVAMDRLKELERHRDVERRMEEDRLLREALKEREDSEKDAARADSASGVALSRTHTDPMFVRPPSPVSSLVRPPSTQEQLLSMLTRGSVFLKHGRAGSPHPRFVWVSVDFSTIAWRQVGTQAVKGSISTSSLRKVIAGASSAVFKRGKGRPGRDNACFTIYSDLRTLDLEVELLGNPSSVGVLPEEKRSRDEWVEAFRALIAHVSQDASVPSPRPDSATAKPVPNSSASSLRRGGAQSSSDNRLSLMDEGGKHGSVGDGDLSSDMGSPEVDRYRR